MNLNRNMGIGEWAIAEQHLLATYPAVGRLSTGLSRFLNYCRGAIAPTASLSDLSPVNGQVSVKNFQGQRRFLEVLPELGEAQQRTGHVSGDANHAKIPSLLSASPL